MGPSRSMSAWRSFQGQRDGVALACQYSTASNGRTTTVLCHLYAHGDQSALLFCHPLRWTVESPTLSLKKDHGPAAFFLPEVSRPTTTQGSHSSSTKNTNAPPYYSFGQRAPLCSSIAATYRSLLL